MSASKAQQETVKNRRYKVLHGKVMRMTVKEIAKQTGYDESTVNRDILALRQAGVTHDLIEQERQAHIKALPLATACIIASIMNGDADTACKMVKGMHVWTDKIDGTVGIYKLTDDELKNDMTQLVLEAVKKQREQVKIVEGECEVVVQGSPQDEQGDTNTQASTHKTPTHAQGGV